MVDQKQHNWMVWDDCIRTEIVDFHINWRLRSHPDYDFYAEQSDFHGEGFSMIWGRKLAPGEERSGKR